MTLWAPFTAHLLGSKGGKFATDLPYDEGDDSIERGRCVALLVELVPTEREEFLSCADLFRVGPTRATQI